MSVRLKEKAPSPEKVLVYDASCDLCVALTDWLQRGMPPGQVQMLPNQTPGLAEGLGLSRDALEREVGLITPDGTRSPTACSALGRRRCLLGLGAAAGARGGLLQPAV